MNLVIPMAGKGSRFLEAGFDLPKYMIKVKGRTLLEWSISSLPVDLFSRIVFVGLKEHEEKFQLTSFLREVVLRDFECVLLENVTNGQAETVLKAEPYIELKSDLVIYNIDTYFKSTVLREMLLDPNKKYDGVLGAFIDESTDEKWSFAQLGTDRVIETAEKVKISDYALTGLYHFTRASDFFTAAKRAIGRQATTQGEYYIAPLYNELIKQGLIFKLDPVDEFVPLGTPEEVERFESK